MIRRREFFTGLAALSGLTTASCGWRLGDVRTSSNIVSALDELHLFTWSQYTDNNLLKTFTTQTGIKVLADVYDANEVMLAKLQASGGGSYSLIYPSDYMVGKMVNKGLLKQIDRKRLIGLDNLFPRFQNPEYDPNNSYSVPMSWGTTGFIYNSEKITAAPQDWNYLWQNQQKLSKRITLLNDTREVIGGVLKMLGYSYNSQNETQIKQAYEKLQILKPDIAAFSTDGWQNQIMSGDLYLAMCYSSNAFQLTRENPKLKYVTPQSGSSLWTDTIAIPQTSSNLNGAYEWINFMLKPEVAARMSQRLGIATPNSAAFELLPLQIKNNSTLFPPENVLQKCERLAPIGEFEEVYERYWTKLTSG
ncbi:spermidine/putrescine ABC transporter substrate-binding protein [Rivularia sp. UHCC 0363]|uniref:ABC transporter substrate-binding protein n=1 Tax=Rivularia sp. UHCC 0363 TaxID=3110244 RepID=UPI002B1E9B99|nr:spermidine/putrescine ABC transporter substrate-binding protein [Rivularia sp. UHCC 0363]MEA5592892.1 spermidine/putrescine ABC transporter substrate-binding protein [Rivularia sp. UHCC 0363]